MSITGKIAGPNRYARFFAKALGHAKRESRYVINRYLKGRSIPDSPIFIVGCGHSGTSLVLAVLGEHSNLHAIPFESSVASKPPEYARAMLKQFARWTVAEGKGRWVEKTPGHILHIDKIFDLEPTAKVLLILRDGRDVACSIKDRTNDFARGVERWVRDNEAGEAYWNNNQVLVFKYENLIENFEVTISQITKFLGEPYEGALEEYHSRPKKFYSNDISKPENAFGVNHEQYRNWQINQKLFDGRGKWKLKMTEEEKELFKRVAGDKLISYQYETELNW